MTEIASEIITPEASRIMEGLRDTGYDYNTAMADIIDNSIAAGATKVEITSEQDMSGNLRVTIADNGAGMTRAELTDAMRYGAPPRKNKHSLGKFGLGLKTASTACCRKLKVITRKDIELSCAVWDLDYIAEHGEWRLLLPEPEPWEIEELDECAQGESGTLVVWEECDRLLSSRYSNPASSAFKRAFERSNKVLKQHIAMVFQRFLDISDSRAENVTIALNGENIEPWDPFARKYRDDYGSEDIPVDEDPDINSSATVHVTAYIVPTRQELENDAERRNVYPSVDKDLKQFTDDSLSGFYVYRENRLIHWGDWFNMPGIDFHNRLCRFEMSFDAELDNDFQVDIKKSRILINDMLRDRIYEFANPIKKEGNRVYRTQERTEVTEKSGDIHKSSNDTLEDTSGLVGATVTQVGDSQVEIQNRFGKTVVPYGIDADDPDNKDAIVTVSTIDDGLLWQPSLNNGTRGVQLNAGHEFYKRFYGANSDNPAAVRAMDYVFWTLAQAETEAMGEAAEANLEEARYQASRKLRKLAQQLPEVSADDFEG